MPQRTRPEQSAAGISTPICLRASDLYMIVGALREQRAALRKKIDDSLLMAAPESLGAWNDVVKQQTELILYLIKVAETFADTCARNDVPTLPDVWRVVKLSSSWLVYNTDDDHLNKIAVERS